MTLIIALGNSDQIIQISDRRLSINGKLQDDESNKAGVIVTPDSRLAYGFTGLGKTASGFRTSEWLESALYDCAPPDYEVYKILQRLKERASQDFKTLPALQNIQPKHRRLAIAFSGYLHKYDPPRAVFAKISNFPGFACANGPRNPDQFEFAGSIENRPDSNFAQIKMAGFTNAITEKDLAALQQLLSKRKPARAIIGKAIKVIYTTADRPKSKGTIGKQLTSIVIPRDQIDTVISNYHSGVATYKTYMPVSLFLMGDGQRQVYRDISIEAVDPSDTLPIEWPKVGRNDPCPCGSGKKYKHCCRQRECS